MKLSPLVRWIACICVGQLLCLGADLLAAESPVRITPSQAFQVESPGWRGEPWRHRVHVVNDPKATSSCVGFIHLRGGRRDDAVNKIDPIVQHFTQKSHCFVAQISDLPNQPIDGMIEDAILARSFRMYLDDERQQRTALHAMVDGVHAVLRHLQEKFGIRRFVLSGQSKRGWITWLVAAENPRVIAIAPVVFDLLDFQNNLELHRQVYGSFTAPLADYIRERVFDHMKQNNFRRLSRMIDPLHLDLKIPKFLVHAANDQFFVPDSSLQYWSRLLGPKYLRYVPNVGHHIDDHPQSYFDDLHTFVAAVANNKGLPTVKCHEQKNRLSWSASSPAARLVYRVATSSARDFRLGSAEYRMIKEVENTRAFDLHLTKSIQWSAHLIETEFLVAEGPWHQSCPVWVGQAQPPSTSKLMKTQNGSP